MIIASYFQGWDDVAQNLRLNWIPQIKNCGFNGIVMIADFSNPDIDNAFGPAAKSAGLNIILSPNTGDYPKLNDVYNTVGNVIAWDLMDDADIAGLAKTQERIALIKPAIKVPGVKTYITVSKGADHTVFANLADMYHVQNYHYREGLKRWSWTRMLEARKACKGILLHGPYLGKLKSHDWAVKIGRQDYMIDGEYVPLSYNKTSVMAALCAGANGVVYYPLFEGIAEQVGKNNKYYSAMLERTDLFEGYKNFHNNVLKKYEIYFDTGTRITFDDGDVFGAMFTLPNGDWIRVEIFAASEYDADFRIIDSKDSTLRTLFTPPPTPSTVKVAVQEGQVNLTGTNVKFTV